MFKATMRFNYGITLETIKNKASKVQFSDDIFAMMKWPDRVEIQVFDPTLITLSCFAS